MSTINNNNNNNNNNNEINENDIGFLHYLKKKENKKQQTITTNNYGAGLISGASPSILKAVLTNKMNPVDIMNEVIESERYNIIR